MISKKVVSQIKDDLENTEKTITEIAHQYEISRTTVMNINAGRTHGENREYPIRANPNNYFAKNEIAFIQHLAFLGYSIKQIHIIMTKGSYSTIANILKPSSEKFKYKANSRLDRRRDIFDILVTPHAAFINSYSNILTYDDAVYIKFLGRFMANMVDVIYIYLPIMETEIMAMEYPLESREDVKRYLEWGGTAIQNIWWIKNIYNNKVNNLEESPVFYNNFNIERFKQIDENIDLTIVEEMVNFRTKENYKRNPNI